MNADQIAVITSPAPWNIVLAGPGSGKSTVIVERAKHLKEAGVNPLAMAFVTFTNIGAKVLRRRLADAVGQVGFVGTLHGMMLMLLRRHDPNWVLVGEDDSDEFLHRHAKIMGYKGTEADLQAARSLDEYSSAMTPAMRAVRAYRTFMRSERMLDFDMVLTEGHALVHGLGFKNPWTHWSVDEFQDSGPVDAKIYLSANPEHLLVVGDPDQSIFGFRGARPANVTDYWNDPRFSRHILSQNYRCSSLICDTANAVISINSDRIDKLTVSAVDHAGDVATLACASDTAERQAVLAFVRQRMAEGIAPHEIAALCRTNRLANEIRDELREAKLPVAEVEPEKKPKDWPLLILLITLIATPTSWAQARLFARLQAKFLKTDPAVGEQCVCDNRKGGGTPTSMWSFPTMQVILSLNADLRRYGISNASHALMAERIRTYRPADAEELLACLRESPETKSTKGVNVLTVHAAKGEEWDAVIVPGAELYHRDDDDAEASEERRLMFVALTRARRFVQMTAAGTRSCVLQNGQKIIQNREAGRIFNVIEDLCSSKAGM